MPILNFESLVADYNIETNTSFDMVLTKMKNAEKGNDGKERMKVLLNNPRNPGVLVKIEKKRSFAHIYFPWTKRACSNKCCL